MAIRQMRQATGDWPIFRPANVAIPNHVDRKHGPVPLPRMVIAAVLFVSVSYTPSMELAAEDRLGGRQATLLAKGPGFFVHAVSQSSGYQFLHMEIETGVLKPLLSVRPAVDSDSASGGSSAGRVLGVANDDERLYVLVSDNDTVGRRLGLASAASRDAPTQAKLYVFYISDGTVLHREDISLPSDGDALVETLGEGLLSLRADGVECLRIGLIFDGIQLTSRYDPLSGAELPVQPNVLDPSRDYEK